MSCESDWTWSAPAFPGSECRRLDFSLIFSSMVLSIIPSGCFLLLAGLQLYGLRDAKEVVRREKGSMMLCGAKMLCAGLGVVGSIVSLAGWVSAGESEAIGTSAASLLIPVSLLILALSTLEHFRRLQSSHLLSLYLVLATIFDIVRLRTFYLVSYNTSKTLFLSAFLLTFSSRFLLFILENISKRTWIASAHLAPESTAPPLSRWFLFWVVQIMLKGHKSAKLGLNDLGQVNYDSAHYYARFEKAWVQQKGKNRPVARAVAKAFWAELLMPIPPLVVWCLLLMAVPLELGGLLRFLNSWQTDTPQPESYGWALVAAFCLTYFLTPLTVAASSLAYFEAAAVLKQALAEAVFRKALRMHLSVSHDTNMGSMVSYVSLDVERIVGCAEVPYKALGVVILMALGLPIIANEFGISWLACLISCVITIIMIPITAKTFVVSQTKFSAKTDLRVGYLSSMLKSIVTVKSSAYEYAIGMHYDKLREDELKEMASYRTKWAITGLFYNGVFATIRIFTLGAFALAAMASDTIVFANAPVFVAYAVLETFSVLFYGVIWNFASILSAWASLCRIEGFLLAEDRQQAVKYLEGMESALTSMSDIKAEKPLESGPPKVFFSQASIGLKQTAFLRGLTFECPAGQLTMLTGSVASGKSSCLLAILGEYDVLSGSINSSNECSTAYASQDAYLQSGATIKENILWGSSYSLNRYEETIRACALDYDLNDMVEGDDRVANGLSGGQRGRIALARCVYAQADLILLDDPLCALDNKIEARVWQALFGDSGLLCGRTVVMVSNSVKRFRRADHIVFLENGKCADQGSYDYLKNRSQSSFLSFLALRKGIEETEETALLSPKYEIADHSKNMEAALVGTVDKEAHATTHGFAKAALFYFSQAGWGRVAIDILLCAAAWPLFSIGFSLYIRFWTDNASNEKDQDAWKWISGLCGITVFYLLCAGWWWQYQFRILPVCSGRKTQRMSFTRLLNAPFDYFRVNSIGYILNRFSLDLYDYETIFAIDLMSTIQGVFVTCSQVALVSVSTRYALILAAAAVIGYECLRRFYIKTSSQLRKVLSAAQTPLLTACEELVEGLPLIRAFEQQGRMTLEATKRITQSTTPYLTLQSTKMWYTLCLSFISLLFSMVLLPIAVANRRGTSQGNIALAIIQLIKIPGSLQSLMERYTEAEIHSVAIHRLQHMLELQPEEAQTDMTKQSDNKTLNWLIEPNILLENVTLKYNTDDPAALKNINLKIQAGERIGICGRSGSGKSSFLSALFRLYEIEENGSVSISGVDTRTIPRQALRKKLTLISQEPMLLSCSLRLNLDPEGEHDDATIWNALDKARCKTYVEDLDGKLDYEVSKTGQAISRGTRQLLALARAILRDRPILCLDEASAALDKATDQTIQEVLRTAFSKVTMLVVAHRISTIADMDRIVCMERGEIVEVGTPKELLADSKGVFAELSKLDE